MKISDYMTKSPHTIGQEQTLRRAHEMMREFSIRHLPVLHGGQLVGTVSLRDLDLTEGLAGVDPEETVVEEAMSADPVIVRSGAALRPVLDTMLEQGVGSAIISEGTEVIGVFTAVDAMRALRDVLAK